jgi:hypothetical protein
MDLGTIHSRLIKGRYTSAEAVWADIQLVWRNCRTYNEAGSEVYKAAEELAGFAEQLWKQGRLPMVCFLLLTTCMHEPSRAATHQHSITFRALMASLPHLARIPSSLEHLRPAHREHV